MMMSGESSVRASVSVIVPTFNCARFLGEAVDSIIAQTIPVSQIIIVDDGSTDGTEQVVSRFIDPRIEYIKQKNAGVSAARNTGLDAARGELVTFLDADDRWRPTFVERMESLLTTDPTAVCAFANFLRFDHETGRRMTDQFQYYPELRNVPNRIPENKAFDTLVSCGEFPAYTVVMMFRRALIAPLRFNTSLKLCEDAHFCLQAFMRGAVIFTDEVLADVRRHDGNASHEVGEMAIAKLEALRALDQHVAGKHVAAYHDRLVKAQVDAAIHRIRSGWRHYRECLSIPGSRRRKLKGLVRMALSVF